MPLMRRRPLLRAAAVGGGAYMAGKSRARSQERESQQDGQVSPDDETGNFHGAENTPAIVTEL